MGSSLICLRDEDEFFGLVALGNDVLVGRNPRAPRGFKVDSDFFGFLEGK